MSVTVTATVTMPLDFKLLYGRELEPYLDALGGLRIAVFREFPYLYEGKIESEREYLRTYSQASGSFVCLAFDGETAVGATTCVPMQEEGPEFQEPFLQAGWDISKICYFGESILLPEYRGQGVGKAFFQYREAHAQSLGLPITAFCAVDRLAEHPACPAGYRPLDTFWQAQGYEKRPELQAKFTWLEVGEAEETTKTLTFWVKGATSV